MRGPCAGGTTLPDAQACTCVSPLVKRQLPCVRGKTLAREVMGRMSFRPRPSMRSPCTAEGRTQLRDHAQSLIGCRMQDTRQGAVEGPCAVAAQQRVGRS